MREGKRVCAVFYGHPGVYVRRPTPRSRRARQEGYQARMLPAVSAEDCLFADLGVDPGEHGWQSWEATGFLLRGYEPDPAGGARALAGRRDRETRLEPRPRSARCCSALAEGLGELYPPEHELVFYRASSTRSPPRRREACRCTSSPRSGRRRRRRSTCRRCRATGRPRDGRATRRSRCHSVEPEQGPGALDGDQCSPCAS